MSVIRADTLICTFARSRQARSVKVTPRPHASGCPDCGHPINVSGLCGKCHACSFCCKHRIRDAGEVTL
jgi:hypothetical protein